MLVVVLLGPPRAHAAGRLVAATPPRFERVDATHELPQASVYDLAERGDGYLWLTTLDGLVRFDGVRLHVYDATSPGLATSRLTALAVHQSGDLWIGTEDGRLVRMRGDRFTTLPAHGSFGGVTGLRFDATGERLLVMQQLGGWALTLVDGDEPSLEPQGPPVVGQSDYGHTMALLDARTLWAAQDDGFHAVPLPPELYDHARIILRSDARSGTTWLQKEGTVWRVEGDRLVAFGGEQALPADAIPLGWDARGDLWLRSSRPPYLGRLDREGRHHRYDEAAGIDPFATPLLVYVDREDGLWVGTTIGLYRYLGESITGVVWSNDGLETPVASYFEASSGDTWIEGRDDGLTVIAPSGSSVALTTLNDAGRMVMRMDRFPGFVDGAGQSSPVKLGVRTFREDAEGRVWVGAEAGLFVHRGGYELTMVTSLRGINDVLVDDDGLWVATGSSVARVEDDALRMVLGRDRGLPGEAIALLLDRQGTLWVGTRRGVARRVGDRLEPVPGLGETIGQARALHEDAAGLLWVGTYDRGLLRLAPDGSVAHVGPEHGLPSGGAFTLHFDGRGFLWVTSNRGLVRASVEELEQVLTTGEGHVHAVLYDMDEGLPASECNGGFGNAAYPCDADRAWCMHTMGGVARARLDEARVVSSPPVAVIEEIAIDGIPRAPEGDRLTVVPGDHDVVVRYTGAAFEGAATVTFDYRLRGRDERWVSVGTRREVIFSDLPPGEYTLEILAESREGKSSPEPARLLIIVMPAWWERAVVRWLVLLAAAGLVTTMVRWRLRGLERRHRHEEATLRAAAEELERRVRERTAVLNEEVIERRRAEEAARQASAVKSAFLAQMSHELRTPMNAILGLSELLARSELRPEQRKWVQTLRSSGDALLSLIDDVLDFSRIEAGRIELELRSFDPAAIVEEAVEIVQPSAKAKGLALSWHAAPGLPAAVESDPSRIRQVLLNLLSNAIKFTAAGTVEVHVAARERPSADGLLLDLVVRDTGIGIGAVERHRIFEPFTQAEASTSRRFGGTGLGLAIVRGLVERLGGSLALESTVGVGSTFTVTLPVTRTSAAPAGVPASEPEQAHDLRALRVLLTEDDPVNQLVAKALLRTCGCECTVASSGSEALACLAEQGFDVVLMDLHMPGMSGLEATRRLRAELPPERQPWVIALTAAVTVEDREECRAAGMDDFIGKPIGAEALARALARAQASLAARRGA